MLKGKEAALVFLGNAVKECNWRCSCELKVLREMKPNPNASNPKTGC